MAYNPSTSRAECNLHAGLVNQDSINDPRTFNRESYNSFDKSQLRIDTQLFDEIRPVYFDPAIAGDTKRIRAMQDLRTYTLKSPLLTPVKMHRAFFQVPWSVIMPRTWERIIRQPISGEDIEGKVNPYIPLTGLAADSPSGSQLNGHPGIIGLFTRLEYLLNNVPSLQTDPTLRPNYFGVLARMVYLYTNIFGASSLPRLLKCRISRPYLEVSQEAYSPEQMMSRLIGVIRGHDYTQDGGKKWQQFNEGSSIVISYHTSENEHRVVQCESAKDVLNAIREMVLYGVDLSMSIDGLSTNVDWADLPALAQFVLTGNMESAAGTFSKVLLARYPDNTAADADLYDNTYNIMPCIAYQCVVRQFFTNSKIDPVYSAKQWQQSVIGSLTKAAADLGLTDSYPYSEQNGVAFDLDAYSAGAWETALDIISQCTTNWMGSSGIPGAWKTALPLAIGYFEELFTLGQSMRYGDYFTAARTRPLAVGDVSVSVNASKVSAIDVNYSLWMQRFLNGVNRVNQSIYDYLQSMTGILPARREPQPNFIASETYNIGGMEVENTAEQQGNIVTLLRNSESRTIYEFMNDEESFIIGVDTFSLAYCYRDAMHKVAEMNDRLDWFNSFMQHVGDQSVSVEELMSPENVQLFKEPISYQLRYAQFKFSFNDACGGFLSKSSTLDSWAAMFDIEKAKVFSDSDSTNNRPILDSYFIRNHNYDFDKFYQSLTGDNAADYFHFIKSVYFPDVTNSKQQAYPALL